MKDQDMLLVVIIIVIAAVLFVMFTAQGKNIWDKILKMLGLKDDFSAYDSYNECKKAGHTDVYCGYASATPPYHTGSPDEFSEGQYHYPNSVKRQKRKGYDTLEGHDMKKEDYALYHRY